MQNKNIFRHAYVLTLKNPLLWLFGLVLFGGFNLYLVNFFALLPDKYNWSSISFWYIFAQISDDAGIFLLISIIAFLLLNLVKVNFIVAAHNLIHTTSEDKCQLCHHRKNLDSPQSRLYAVWWGRILLASLYTVFLTMIFSVPSNIFAVHNSYTNVAAMILNLFALIIVVAAIGTWNAFTGYFIVWYGLGFRAAAQAAASLIVTRFKKILEFVVVLSIIYTISVVIGNAFIHAWQHGVPGLEQGGARVIFLLMFVLWLAVNNTYFNLAFLLFFDSTVTAIPAEKPEALPQAQ